MTYGEGDGPSALTDMVVVRSSLTDVIASTDIDTPFATQVSIADELPNIQAGDAIRLTARGIFSTFVSAGAVTISVTNSGAALLTTGAQTVAGNLTDRGWWLEAILVAAPSGSNNQGHFMYSTTSRLWDAMDMENGANSVVSVATGSLAISVLWGTADPSNSITLRQLILQRLPNG